MIVVVFKWLFRVGKMLLVIIVDNYYYVGCINLINIIVWWKYGKDMCMVKIKRW